MFLDTTSGEESKTEKSVNISDKSAPSGYRLAAHRYMVAKRKGLIEGPRTRTQALKITKTSQETSGDSETTINYLSDSVPPPRKCRQLPLVGLNQIISGSKDYYWFKSSYGTVLG